MKAVQRVSTALCRYMGASEPVARQGAKQLAPQLSEMLSGASKGEKKKFLNALENLAQEKGNVDEQYQVLYKTLTKGKPLGTVEYKEASNMYHALTQPISTRRAVLQMQREIPEIVTSSMKESIDKAFAEVTTPENMSKIVKEAYKQTVKDSITLTGRTFMYPINKALSLRIPQAVRQELEPLVRLPKNKFAQKYYEHLLETKGLTGRAPSKIVVTESSAKLTPLQMMLGGENIQGGFNPCFNTIKYSKEFSKASRAVQAELLSHELQHFQQADEVIRTFGIERYIQAQKNRIATSFKKEYGNTKSHSEIMQMVEAEAKKENIDEVIKTAFAESIKAPRISLNSPEGQRAAKYLEGFDSYEGLGSGIFMDFSKSYRQNPLEVEAYAVGAKARRPIRIIENLNLESV